MSNNLFDAEKVSCCMDGESMAYLDELCRNEKARSCWSRFHFIQSVMRDSQATPLLAEDFHTRVMQSLEDEPTILAPRLSVKSKLSLSQQIIKPIAGLAIAATVAAVAVMGFQNFYPSETSQALLSSIEGTSSSASLEVAQQNNLVSSEAEIILANDAIVDELDSYLLRHMEQSAGGGSAQGMLPYVRLAGYNDSQ